MRVPRPRPAYVDNDAWLWAKLNGMSRWDLARAPSALAAQPDLFASIESYCTFIGYPRSGHSLVGSIIDAHPRALISHRLDALKYASAGRSLDEILYLIAKNSQRFARSGRHLTAYSYEIPGQGRSGQPLLMGDQEGRLSTMRLQRDPDLVTALIGARKVKPRYVHVIRDPYDNVATMANRRHQRLGPMIERYLALCRAVAALKSHLDEADVIDVYYEDVIAEPSVQIRRVCDFLGLEADDGWVARSAAIVYAKPNRSRATRRWGTDELRAIGSALAAFEHLRRYREHDLPPTTIRER